MALRPLHDDASFVRAVNAAQDFHQRRFPCAVFTQQGVNFPFRNRQVDFRQRIDAGKSLGDLLQLQNRIHRCSIST